jgi:hypothetical protein
MDDDPANAETLEFSLQAFVTDINYIMSVFDLFSEKKNQDDTHLLSTLLFQNLPESLKEHDFLLMSLLDGAYIIQKALLKAKNYKVFDIIKFIL